MSYRTKGLAVLAVACLMVFAGAAIAQTGTTTETKSFEVVSVDGNKVVVRGAEGSKELTVTDDFRVNVGGKQVSVHDLKPGMKGTATITTTTTTTPVYTTEVKNGEVIKVSGSSVIVRTEQGFRSFSEGEMHHRNVTILRDGKPVKLSALNVGDRLSATIVTEGEPQVMTERQVQASVTPDSPKSHTAAASTAKADSASGNSGGAAAPAATETAAASGEGASAATLPETASPLPLLALIGMVALAIGSTLAWRRRHE